MPRGRYQQAAECYDRAFTVQEGTPDDYYQAAVAWASAGDRDRATGYLQNAIDQGWQHSAALQGTEAFSPWRGTEPWGGIERRFAEDS